MDFLCKLLPRVHALCAKLGSLLLLFQRGPLVRILFPEARLFAGSGLAQISGWSVTAVAGLGAFDTVAGATTVAQVTPVANSLTVPAAVGSYLTFLCQVSGAPTVPGSWTVSDPLPPGLVHVTGKYKPTDLISGTPTQAGSYSVTVSSWEYSNFAGGTSSKDFTIVVGPRIITAQPESVMISSGSSAVLSVTGNPGNGTALAYQWYRGVSPSTAEPVAGATSSTYTTAALMATSSFWVRVTRMAGGAAIVANSETATLTTGVIPAITRHPLPVSVARGATATLSVEVSGTSPVFQWCRGMPGNVVEPIAGATEASFTTPALEATTRYWVRVSNGLGSADSSDAVVMVTVPDPFLDWRTSCFNTAELENPAISGADADPDGDGFSNTDEYVLGTPPVIADAPLLNLVAFSGRTDFDFAARLATGPGYQGKTRHYAVETNGDLSSENWSTLPGCENITPESGFRFSTSVPRTVEHSFYRLKVWLTPE